MQTRRFWKGTEINHPEPQHDKCILVFGSNPEGRNSLGLADIAKRYWGAGYGIECGRGLHGKAYALVTKNLTKDFLEPSTGIKYGRQGSKSVSLCMIRDNIKELYECCVKHPELSFIVPYTKQAKNLNGHTGLEVFNCFTCELTVPHNVVFHNSFRGFIENIEK